MNLEQLEQQYTDRTGHSLEGLSVLQRIRCGYYTLGYSDTLTVSFEQWMNLSEEIVSSGLGVVRPDGSLGLFTVQGQVRVECERFEDVRDDELEVTHRGVLSERLEALRGYDYTPTEVMILHEATQAARKAHNAK